jgi:hypothetical protein
VEVNVRGVNGSGEKSMNFLHMRNYSQRFMLGSLFFGVGHAKTNTLLGVAAGAAAYNGGILPFLERKMRLATQFHKA